MPNDLINEDPIIARNFYLEIDGGDKVPLTGISGFDVEVDVVDVNQNLPGGQQVHIKTRGGTLQVSAVTLSRVAPTSVTSDPIWPWFLLIREEGTAGQRKNGSIVLTDQVGKELARYNFFNGWPSKITTGDMEVGANNHLTEQITLVSERMDRVK
jgi:phage tail-like protein